MCVCNSLKLNNIQLTFNEHSACFYGDTELLSASSPIYGNLTAADL